MSAKLHIAVFGAGGQVGSALMRLGPQSGVEVWGFNSHQANVTNLAAVQEALAQSHAKVAVNAAAYTAVDKAESDRDRAFAVNRDGAANIAAAAQSANIPVIHISTDYVFDGTKKGAYAETDATAPLGVYGASKLAGEGEVLARAKRAVILRTAWVFGLEGANFVKTMLRLGNERDILRVVNDQRGAPTFADDLAEVIIAVATRFAAGEGAPGVFHLTGGGAATWFEFARAIFDRGYERGGPRPDIEPIETADYPTPAKRPANSVLDCAKIKRVFGVEMPEWRDALERMLDVYLEEHPGGRA